MKRQKRKSNNFCFYGNFRRTRTRTRTWTRTRTQKRTFSWDRSELGTEISWDSIVTGLKRVTGLSSMTGLDRYGTDRGLTEM